MNPYAEQLKGKLESLYQRWERLRDEGAEQSAGVTDGACLNRYRMYIQKAKQEIKQKLPVSLYPDIYYRPDPEEMHPEYMVKGDAIRERANKAYYQYRTDPNFQYLAESVYRIPRQEAARLGVTEALDSVYMLEHDLQNDNLLALRKHENPQDMTRFLRITAQKVRALTPPDGAQLHMFHSYEPPDAGQWEPDYEPPTYRWDI